ncbi:bacteriocin fulvocin C-related protein [Streptomyces boninensis]|uniref:bacteriocin fulvocin C-related protein n=1 Tax=Streptomyces boninensis TaxID=2039455 RepID=UPI003B212EF2
MRHTHPLLGRRRCGRPRQHHASHLRTYRDAHPDLAAERMTRDVHRRLERLREDAIAAYGLDEARALLATLGPPQRAASPLAGCQCSCASDWCSGSCVSM